MQENENQPITNSSEAKALRKKQQQPQCLRLQDRDYLALKLICDLGYLTADQIALYIFRSTNKNTRRRLYMLEKAGYIQGIYRRDKVANRKIYIPKFKNLDGVVDEKTHLRCVSTMNSRPWFRPHFEHEDKIRSWAIRIQNSFKNCTADLDFMRYWYRPTLKKVDFNDTTLIPDLTI